MHSFLYAIKLSFPRLIQQKLLANPGYTKPLPAISQALKRNGPNAIVSSANESKYDQPGQKTITEALKIVRTDSSSPECLHFFEYPDRCYSLSSSNV